MTRSIRTAVVPAALLLGFVFGVSCDDNGAGVPGVTGGDPFSTTPTGGPGAGTATPGGTTTGGTGTSGGATVGGGTVGGGATAGPGTGLPTGGGGTPTGGGGTPTAGTSGTGTGGTSGTPTAGTSGTRPGGSTGSGGSTSTGGATGTGGSSGAGFGCQVGTALCSNGKDDDGDGKIDAADIECVGPCDNDEKTFATGIPGDNVDACKQDCFFDGNSGQGDDGCEWNLKCDKANPGGNSCPYDASYRNCPTAQSQRCIDTCRKLTPNGCDCFGCCAVTVNNQAAFVKLVPTCTAANFGDPNACPRCTQTTSCINTCERCEVCFGKPTPPADCNLPPPGTVVGTGGSTGSGGTGGSSGTGGSMGTAGTSGSGGSTGTGGSGGMQPPPGSQPCAIGVTYCGDGGSCGAGAYCLTGCCLIP